MLLKGKNSPINKNIKGITFENRKLIVKKNNYENEMLKIKEIYENT